MIEKDIGQSISCFFSFEIQKSNLIQLLNGVPSMFKVNGVAMDLTETSYYMGSLSK